MTTIAKGIVFTGDVAHYVHEQSFTVDGDTKCIRLRFSGGGKALYFHVFDSTGALRLQRMCFPDPCEVILHEDEARTGPGTVPGRLPPGQWVIRAFTYAYKRDVAWGDLDFEVGMDTDVEPEDVVMAGNRNWARRSSDGESIVLKEFEPKEGRSGNEEWLSGDFHVHSVLSDGSSLPADLLEEGIGKKLDFFFITDHNSLTTGFPPREGIDVYPSYEVTTYAGHLNALGLDYLPNRILSAGGTHTWAELLSTLIRDFRNKGILVSINHPFLEPWHWMYDDLPLEWIDGLEILSDPRSAPTRQPNEKAFSLIDLLWNNGYRIAGIGGSDTHTKYSDSQLGEPVTKVFALRGSLSSMLSGIKTGRVQIFLDTDCSFSYSIGGRKVLPGTGVGYGSDEVVEFGLQTHEDCDPLLLRVVENGITVDEKDVHPGDKLQASRVWKRSSEWMRCELRDGKGSIRGFVNPLFRGRREPGIRRWGDARGLLE
jgi:hypothetical protein